jgi:hypothetical protein
MRGVCLGVLLALIIIGVLGTAGGVFAACPSDNYYINQSMVLDGSFCNINDSDNDGVIIINSDDILLDCNGSVFNNSGYYAYTIGLAANGFQNLTIKNCTFQNYYNGISFVSMQDSYVNYSNSINNVYAGIVIGNSTNIVLEGDYFENNGFGVVSYMNIGDFTFNNNMINNNNTFGMMFYGNKVSNVYLSGNTITNSYEFDIYNVNSTGIDFGSGISYDSLRMEWAFKYNITNSSGDPLIGYTVTGHDRYGNTNYIPMPHGYPPAFGPFVVEYIENSSGITNYNPYTLNVTKPGYNPASTIVNFTQSLTIHISLNKTSVPPADTGAPSIDNHSVTPQSVANGSSVVIRAGASDNVGVDSLWAVVDYPGAGSDTIMLANEMGYTYNVSLLGRHDVIFFANDTSGNTTNVTEYFDSFAPVSININVSENDGDGVDSDVVVYQNGTTAQVAAFSSSSGDFQSRTLPNGTYDLQFSAFGGDFVVLLEDVDIWNNVDNLMRMDDPPTVSGFQLTYAAETDYSFGSAVVRVYYSSGDVSDENNIKLYVCQDWNFTSRYCNSTWNETSASLNTTDNYFELSVSGFSAFSIMQDAYCGDGICSSSENSTSCSADCNCTNGQTRLCALNNIGECGAGSETCVGGSWSGCPSPTTEICNQKDDDCDGTIDNVGGGTSIITSFCGCYDGASPSTEIFDGIDNNCNGFIDDGCVCNESETEVCGSNIGACVQGTRTCTNCKWGSCEGQIGPFEEVCGNGMDDDCDGQIDEIADCIVENNETCAYGPIPATGCKCGIGTYASGYCCNGVYKIEPCPDFPWWILIIVGGAVLAAAAIYYFLHEKAGKKGQEDEWTALEKKYTPARM